MLITCLFVVSALLRNQAFAHNESAFMTAEEHLFHDLTENNPHLRPVLKHRDTVNVTLGLALIDIIEVDEWKGHIAIEAWLKMKWVAANMQWDPKDYDGIAEIKLPVDKIWQPDISLYNGGADAIQFQNRKAIINNHGSVIWIPQVVTKANCLFNMRSFPFDSHDCEFKFGSWVYHGNEVSLDVWGQYFEMDLSNFAKELEWNVHNTSVKRNIKQYACCFEPYHSISFTLHLKRKSTYLSYVYLSPIVLIALMSPFVFLLPYRQSQRFSLGGSLLICLVVLLVGFEGVFPPTFEGLPLVGVYYMSVIVLLIGCMVLSAIILSLADKASTPPRILKTILGEGLGRLLCVKKENYSTLVDQEGEDAIEMRKADDVTWRYIASVLDRFFFILYVIFSIILAVALATPR